MCRFYGQCMLFLFVTASALRPIPNRIQRVSSKCMTVRTDEINKWIVSQGNVVEIREAPNQWSCFDFTRERELSRPQSNPQFHSICHLLGVKIDDIRVSVTERDETLYCKAKNNVRKGEVLFSLPLGICLDVNKAVTKFGQLTAQLRTGNCTGEIDI